MRSSSENKAMVQMLVASCTAALVWAMAAGGGAAEDALRADGTYQGRHYRLHATIDAPKPYQNVPYSLELDFGARLKQQNVKGTFDRFSVIVKRRDASSGKLQDVHYNLCDDFLTADKGRVNWLIEDTKDREYVIFYDVKEHGPFLPPHLHRPRGLRRQRPL